MRGFLKSVKKDRGLLALALPTTIWYLLFSYLPMIGILIAFKNFRINGKGFFSSLFSSQWVGLKNFQFLFKTSDAWIITRNTVCYNLVFIVLGIVLPVIVALMLNELINKKMAKVYQSAMFLPYFLSWVVVSYCLFAFLSVDKGYINRVLMSMSKKPISWYSIPKYWPFIIILMSQWKGIGYNTVVYLASISGIDKTYYEAAMIDGATKWQQIRYITLPLLKPVVTILFILAIGKIFNADFGLFYQLPMNSGPLYPVTNVIDTYVYRGMMSMGELGMSSAAGLYQSVVGFILIMVSNFIVKKYDSENSLF